MDSKGDKKTRSIKEIAPRQEGRKNPSVKAKKSRTLKKPNNKKKSAPSRNATKAPQVDKTRYSLFAPIKEQFAVLIEYLNLLDEKKEDLRTEILVFVQYFDLVRMNSLMYLNNLLGKL